MTAEPQNDSINAPSVLWKAFDVLDTFNQSRRELTLSDIARRSGLPKSTVHRILTMLLEVKAVERTGHGYRVGLRMFSLGTCTAEVRLKDVAMPYLERLRRVTRQTVHLAVIEHADVVYLGKLTSSVSPPTPAVVGGRLPAETTGVGKALLAFGDRPSSATYGGNRPTNRPRYAEGWGDYIEEVRRSGIAGDREEAAPGLACVATPVLISDRAVAAISVGFTAAAGDGQAFVNPLREASIAISRALAGVLPDRYEPHGIGV